MHTATVLAEIDCDIDTRVTLFLVRIVGCMHLPGEVTCMGCMLYAGQYTILDFSTVSNKSVSKYMYIIKF